MIDNEKAHTLAKINQEMIDAALTLEDAIKKRDSTALLRIKSYLIEAQKKFDSSLKS